MPVSALRRVASRGSALREGLAALRRGLAPSPQDCRPLPPAPITVATYNIHKCVGTDRVFDPGRIAEVIAELDVDLLALQEVDRRFGRRHGLLDMAAIARRTGLDLLPFATEPGGHGWRGNALLVRGGRALAQRRMSLPGGEPRGAVIADIAFGSDRLRVVGAHLGLFRRNRALQTRAILDALAVPEDIPTLILGDLNEWRHGKASSLHALEKGFAAADRGPFTFPSRLPVLRLDRILGRPKGLVLGMSIHDTPLARIASDHLPLKASIDLAAVSVDATVAPALAAAA